MIWGMWERNREKFDGWEGEWMEWDLDTDMELGKLGIIA